MKIFYIRNLLVVFSIIFITLVSFSKTNEVVFYHTASHLIIHSPIGKFRPQDENQQLKYRTRINRLKLQIAEQLKNRYKNRDILNSPALLKLIENDNYLIGEIESLVGILDIDTFNSDKK